MEDYVHRIGRTGHAGCSGLATSFCTDRDLYLVAQIRKAIVDVESGNAVVFATGKTARRKEKELQLQGVKKDLHCLSSHLMDRPYKCGGQIQVHAYDCSSEERGHCG